MINVQRFTLATATCIALAMSVTTHAQALSGSTPVVSSGTITNVVDGDTFDVSLNDPTAFQRISQEAAGNGMRERYLDTQQQTIRVRLANVDTAELGTTEGDALNDWITVALEGTLAYVQCYDWGHYGRVICTLGMGASGEDGDLGYALIRDSHSEYVTHWGRNPFYDEHYQAAARGE